MARQGSRSVSIPPDRRTAAEAFARDRRVSIAALVEYALDMAYRSWDDDHFQAWFSARAAESRANARQSSRDAWVVRRGRMETDGSRRSAEEAARWAHDQGKSDAAAATEFQLTAKSVADARRRLGLGPPPRPESLGAQAARHMEDRGCSPREAGEAYGITRQSVSKARAKLLGGRGARDAQDDAAKAAGGAQGDRP